MAHDRDDHRPMDDAQTLIDAIRREENPSRQSELIEELGKKEVAAAVEPLIEMIQRNEYQSGAAIVALGNIGDPRAIEELIQSFSVQSLGWIAKDALVKFGATAIPPVIDALSHANADVRFQAIRTLAEIPDPRSIEPLQRTIENDSDEANQQLARSNLKHLLLEFLSSPDPALREKAVRGLRWLGDARTIDVLLPLAAGDSSATVRALADETIVHLLQTVEHDPFASHDLPTRRQTTNILLYDIQRQAPELSLSHPQGSAPHPNASKRDGQQAQDLHALDELARAYASHADADIREKAAFAIRQLGTDLLRSPSAQVRLAAVQHLGKLDDPGVAPLLEQLAAHDPRPEVQSAAQAFVTAS